MADLIDQAIELEKELDSAGLRLTVASQVLVEHLHSFSYNIRAVADEYRGFSTQAAKLLELMEGNQPSQRQMAFLDVFERITSAHVLSVEKLSVIFNRRNNHSVDVFDSFLHKRVIYLHYLDQFTKLVDELRLMVPIATRDDAQARFVVKYSIN